MKKSIWASAFALVLLLGVTAPASAQTVKQGDCNEDGQVVISELITLVNILLGTAQVTACEAGDTNDSGDITVNEVVAAVACANGTCPGTGNGPVCGNGDVEEGEDCDDENNFGGDGCAGNCTTEFAVRGTFDSARTIATVQTEGFPVIINLMGEQTFRFGMPRDEDVTDPNGDVVFKANEMPAVVRANELIFQPVRVTGLVCACVRGVDTPSFGPGLTATGSVACGENILSDISYDLVQDHNTTPGSDGNRLGVETGTPDDPTCDDTRELPGGTVSSACTEGDPNVESCANDPGMEEEHPHIGVCNGPRQLTRSGGPAPAGSVFALFNNAIGLLQDRGLCKANATLPNGTCEFADYGPDCMPCTDDDLEKGTAENIPLTTGSAEGIVIDANNSESVQSVPGGSVQIEKDADCLGPCKTVVTGSRFDCDTIIGGSLSGGSLAVAFPSIDAATIGDNVTTATFFNQ